MQFHSAPMPALILLPALVHSQDNNSTSHSTFFPPRSKPFIEIAFKADRAVNGTTLFGHTSTSANLGGTISGAIQGSVVPINAGFEWFAPETENSISFYENSIFLNTSDSVIIRGDAHGTVHYANNAFHGLGTIRFTTSAEAYRNLSYANYIVEWSGNFSTGKAALDVFELTSAGRVDGHPIKALLPPGVPGGF